MSRLEKVDVGVEVIKLYSFLLSIGHFCALIPNAIILEGCEIQNLDWPDTPWVTLVSKEGVMGVNRNYNFHLSGTFFNRQQLFQERGDIGSGTKKQGDEASS